MIEKISGAEFAAIAEVIRSPQFPDLMRGYMEEITDPNNRKEQIQYLNELERSGELPAGKVLVRGEPWMCVESWISRIDNSRLSLVYINITTSSLVDEACMEDRVKLSVPLTLSPLRVEKDDAGLDCVVVDAITGSNIAKVCSNRQILVCVINLVIQEINAKLMRGDRFVVNDFRVMSDGKYKGGEDCVLPVLMDRGGPLGN